MTATARQAMAQRDTTTTMIATGEEDDDDDGGGATGDNVDNDGEGATYDDIDNDCHSATSDEVDDDGDRQQDTTTMAAMTTIPARQRATRATIAIAMTAKKPAHRQPTIYAVGRFEHFYQ